MVDDDPRKMGLRFDGNRVIGCSDDIPRLVERWNVGVILFAIGNIPPEKRTAILNRCRRTAVRIVLVPDLFELLSASLFPSERPPGDSLSADWHGGVPVPQVLEWLAELEALSTPGNAALLARLRLLRNALAAHLVNAPGSNIPTREQSTPAEFQAGYHEAGR